MPLFAARALFERIHARMLETGGGHHDAGFTRPERLEAAMRQFWRPG